MNKKELVSEGYEAPRVGGTKMKKLLVITYIAALAALARCLYGRYPHPGGLGELRYSKYRQCQVLSIVQWLHPIDFSPRTPRNDLGRELL